MSDSAAAISQRKPAKRPPGPKGAFLLGHIVELIRDSMRFLESCTREYGDVVRLKFFHVPVCVLANPVDIESVLSKNSANFLKARDYRAMKSILGNGLLTSEGTFWQKQRKLIQPAFRHENITRYAETMVSETSRMLDGWRAPRRATSTKISWPSRSKSSRAFFSARKFPATRPTWAAHSPS